MTKRHKVNYSFVIILALILLCLVFKPIVIAFIALLFIFLAFVFFACAIVYSLLETIFGADQ